jgi:hypothetical protein
MPTVLAALQAAGISRAEVRLWGAHFTDVEHICGSSGCDTISTDVDATQWTSHALGLNLD